MPVFNNNILAGASGATGGGGSDERSLRFNSGDSSYLNRTPSSAGNRKTWTWSGWIKIDGNFANRNTNYGGSIFFGTHDGQPTWISYNATDPYLQFSFNDGSSYRHNRSQAVFRDSSAWYHVVVALDTTQGTASNRLKMYVNGVQLTDFSTSYTIPQNTQVGFNNTFPHNLGASSASTSGTAYDHFGGLMANIHFVDGQALDYTAFTEFDTNGVLQPIEYAGTYGTNGFHLDFKDNSSSANLGYDAAGSNNWTVNNFSVAAGAGNDSLRDSPSQIADQTDSGAGGEVVGNYCTWNPLNVDKPTNAGGLSTLSNGNLEASGNNTDAVATIGVSSGKWYFEVTRTSGGSNDTNGVGFYLSGTSQEAIYRDNAEFQYDGSNNSYGASWSVNGVVIGVALDLDNTSITFYKDGVSQGVAKSNLPAGTWVPSILNRSTSTFVANFGQRAFTYTAPTGFKCLCTASLPEPTIADPSKHFEAKTYLGNGGTQALTMSNSELSPGFVWIKNRSAGVSHYLQDVVRGSFAYMNSNSTGGENTASGADWFSSFDSNGFTVKYGSTGYGNSAGWNENNTSYVGWAWDAGSSTVTNTDGSISAQVRAQPSAGFSIIKFTNTASNSSVGHGLNAKPELIIWKKTSGTSHWPVYHGSLGATKHLYLDLNNTAGTSSDFWNNTEPTSSVVSTRGEPHSMGSTGDTIMYCFAPVEGYSAVGSCSPNGTNDNIFVYTGFKPKFILARFTSAGDWMMLDTSRRPNGPTGGTLVANVANGEDSYYNSSQVGFDFLSNGFKIRHNGSPLGDSGKTVIYYCVAENPFKYSRAY